MADSQSIRVGLSEMRSDTANWSGSRVIIGEGGGAKSFVFSNSIAAQTMAANPTTTRTLFLPNANGTVAFIPGVAVPGSTITDGTVAFNSGGISFGLNASTITGIMSPASYFPNGKTQQLNAAVTTISGAGAWSLQRLTLPYILPRTVYLLGNLTVDGSTAGTYGLYFALYTFAGSTASTVSSTSVSVSWNSGTTATQSSIYAGQAGLRWRSIPLATWSITPGPYLAGVAITMSGVAGTTGSWSFYGGGGGITDSAPYPGVATPDTSPPYFADGLALVTMGASFPVSIALSDIDQTASNALFQPALRFFASGP